MPSSSPRLVVLDADGTLVREDAGDSTPDLDALEAMDRLRDRTTFALVSGRTAPDARKVVEAAGIDLYVAELGGVLVADGSETVTIPWAHDEDPADVIRGTGILDRILDRYPGLEVDPYGHRITVPLHGDLDAGDIDEIRDLVASRDDRFTVLDNTVGNRIVVLHVAPDGVGKATGVRALQTHLGVGPDATIMVGDSPEDASCHACVRRMYLVANGTPGTVDAPNLVTTSRPNGAGVVEALEAEFDAGT